MNQDQKVGFAILKTAEGKKIYAKTENQFKLAKTIENNQIIFCTGPAGTGKTFMSILMAVKMLQENKIEKIIVTRPMVPAGENPGYLPGEISNKMDPYLRPIFDILEMVHKKTKKREVISNQRNSKANPKSQPKVAETTVQWDNKVEMIPFAFLRGRTFNNAFIICDEGQNTLPEQMRMILTRIGENSKMVINGDLKQTDIKKRNGLDHFLDKLSYNPIKGIDLVTFDKSDIVRNSLINEIEEKIYENTIPYKKETELLNG